LHLISQMMMSILFIPTPLHIPVLSITKASLFFSHSLFLVSFPAFGRRRGASVTTQVRGHIRMRIIYVCRYVYMTTYYMRIIIIIMIIYVCTVHSRRVQKQVFARNVRVQEKYLRYAWCCIMTRPDATVHKDLITAHT
jgi:hypothetical protein